MSGSAVRAIRSRLRARSTDQIASDRSLRATLPVSETLQQFVERMRHARRRGRPRPRRRRQGPFLGGVATGAALAWLLDPHQGHHRRRLLVDRVAASTRRSSRRIGRLVRTRAARAEGKTRGLVHRLRLETSEVPDDATLTHKVESVVFRDPRFPKGQVSVNAEQGEVFLRGQVDRPELIRDLEEAVRKVPGVRAVENLLHEPGTSPPASHAGRRVGRK